MIDVKKLKSIMVLNDVSAAELAGKIGISRKTLCSRFNSGIFMSDEIETIIDYLNIDNPVEVFFPNYLKRLNTKQPA